MGDTVSIFWFRRDLRVDDNAGFYHALRGGNPVLPLFIFDRDILDGLEDKDDRRVSFIHDAVTKLHVQLKKADSTLCVKYGKPLEVFRELMSEYRVSAVYTNHDYEPYARKRDAEVSELLHGRGISFHSYKDQVIFEKSEVMKSDGTPYTVYTPYSNQWKKQVSDFYLRSYPCSKYFGRLYHCGPLDVPRLEDMGFEKVPVNIHAVLDEQLARSYDKTRDIPGIEGTTRLGVHLRFGTISIRQLARQAQQLNTVLLNELIWRDFFQAIFWHFPQVVDHSFKPEYDRIKWRNNEREFEAWCNGMTGYPLVDAGMRELNATGFMHNRVRMVTASFLSKHLLIDWRWGEAYFARKLLDYDLAANNGNWQWAAGCGCDAAPYFRVFNPTLQAEKFDPNGKYIRQWVPELDTFDYPAPIVEHSFARERCLTVYKAALQREG